MAKHFFRINSQKGMPSANRVPNQAFTVELPHKYDQIGVAIAMLVLYNSRGLYAFQFFVELDSASNFVLKEDGTTRDQGGIDNDEASSTEPKMTDKIS